MLFGAARGMWFGIVQIPASSQDRVSGPYSWERVFVTLIEAYEKVVDAEWDFPLLSDSCIRRLCRGLTRKQLCDGDGVEQD